LKRSAIRVGVQTEVTKTEELSGEASQPAASGAGRASPQTQPPQAPCVVAINSTPADADILVDEEFAGNTPSTVNICSKARREGRRSGYQDWVRSMNLYTGSSTRARHSIAAQPNLPSLHRNPLSLLHPQTNCPRQIRPQRRPPYLPSCRKAARNGALGI
jgi:hypothetical protein